MLPSYGRHFCACLCACICFVSFLSIHGTFRRKKEPGIFHAVSIIKVHLHACDKELQ